MTKQNSQRIEKAWAALRQAKCMNDAAKMLKVCRELEEALNEKGMLVSFTHNGCQIRATREAVNKFRELGWRE